MITVAVRDTHTIVTDRQQELQHLNVPGQRICLVREDGQQMVVTVKADRKGGLSNSMIYIMEAHEFSKFVGGASKAHPVQLQIGAEGAVVVGSSTSLGTSPKLQAAAKRLAELQAAIALRAQEEAEAEQLQEIERLTAEAEQRLAPAPAKEAQLKA
jgi:antitoxin component of MazEF toxin-antitoxin module